MSEQEPKRLLESSDGELRSLLEAGKSERPDEAQLLALAAKIGIAGGLGGAGGAGGAGAAGAKAATAAAVKISLATKIGIGLALATAVGVGTVVATRPTAPPETSTDVHVSLVEQPAPSGLASVDPPLVHDPLPSATPSSAKAAPSTPPMDPEGDLKLVMAAQDALRSDPARALALCNEHAKKYPNGNVAQEREVIAIEALVKTGQKPAARARAARFRTAYPGSGHLPRITTILGE